MKSFKHPVTYHQQGVLYVNPTGKKREALYIVERTFESNQDYETVEVYGVKPGSKIPVKDYTERPLEKSEFSDKTYLGELARKILKPQKRKVRMIKPPLFIAEVIKGKGTFTGVYGLGFKEREPDTVNIKENKVINGRDTGVFINLSDIEWQSPEYHAKDIVQAYQEQRMEEVDPWHSNINFH